MVSAAEYAAQDRGTGLVISNMVLMSLAITAIELRFLSRVITPPSNAFASRFWWDDWLALAATVSSRPEISRRLRSVLQACYP